MTKTKFRAHYQGFYWWIAPTGEVKQTSEHGSFEDAWAYRTGNYFETEKEAQEMFRHATKLRSLNRPYDEILC